MRFVRLIIFCLVGLSFQTTQVQATGVVVSTVINPDRQILSRIGDTNVIRVQVRDQSGRPFPFASVTPIVTGRNATLPAQGTLWTNAMGFAYYYLKDTSNSTSEFVDTVQFVSSLAQNAAGTVSGSEARSTLAPTVITYVPRIPIGSIVITTPQSAQMAQSIPITPIDINAGIVGAEVGKIDIFAKVLDENGSIVSGVKVNWTISGAGPDGIGAGVTTTTASSYTSNEGIAITKAYGWLAGTATITATVEKLNESSKIIFAQNDPVEVRTATATANGRAITVTARDRFGNPVKDVPFSATILGNGFWGTGTNIISNVLTDSNGVITFLMLQARKEVEVLIEFGVAPGLATPFGQSGVLAALYGSSAGTNEMDEIGVGNLLQYSLQGTGDMKVTVSAQIDDFEATTAIEEAIKALKAAEDAAALAAEAASATTASALQATQNVSKLSKLVTTEILRVKVQIGKIAILVSKIRKKL
jgi:hypothetical protein